MCYGSVAGLKGFRGGGGTEGTVLASVSGGAAGVVTYAAASVETESALSKGYTTGYRMTGDAGVAGPGSAHTTTVMTEDTGKFVGTTPTFSSGYVQQAPSGGSKFCSNCGTKAEGGKVSS